MRAAIDTTVLVYAVGADSPFRESCMELLRLSGQTNMRLEASVEILQEFLHVRARRTGDRSAAADLTRAVADTILLHDVEVADARRAIDLFAMVPQLDALDAIHAATSLNRGIEVMVSADQGFDAVPGLRRVDPRNAVTELRDRSGGAD